MTEKPLEIDVELTKNNPTTTLYAGLVPFRQMWIAGGFPEIVNKYLHARSEKGFMDADQLFAIIAMQITGGSTLDELAHFKEKIGALKGLNFNIPSPSSAREYLRCFHDQEEADKQQQGKIYIPKPNEYLAGFRGIFAYVFQCAYNKEPRDTLTLDQDATFIPTTTEGALYSYLKETAYSALNTYCPELDIMVGTEFRNGNVKAGHGQTDELDRVLESAPDGVKTINLRSDSAGCQEELLRYCGEGQNERFGKINFAISCPVRKEFKEAAQAVPEESWKPVVKEVVRGGETLRVETGQEWADVYYAFNWMVDSPVDYRFIAVRERFAGKLTPKDIDGQLPIPELIEDLERGNEEMKKLHLTEMNGKIYKVFGMVTNLLEQDGGEIVVWQHGRCGKSEEAHRLLKEELAGGHVVSQKFGASAAWWNITVLALTLVNLFKRNFLPEECHRLRPKSLRFQFFVTLGQIVKHARRKILRICGGQVSEWFLYARDRLMSFRAAAG